MFMCINLPQASRLGRVSIAVALRLPNSDYIGRAGGVSQPALSVLCVDDSTDTKQMEMAHLQTLGASDLAGGYSYIIH